MLFGIDCSNHQRSVDWQQVIASGVQFAIVKASESDDFVDQFFARNWSELGRLMVPRGAYHFARPSVNGPDAEADFFLSVVEPHGIEPGDLLCLDMEDERVPVGQSLSNWSLAWLERVTTRVGFKPIFYTYNAYIGERGLTDPRLAGYALWLASYQNHIPPCPRPWDAISIWQYSSSEPVPGAGPRIDCNRFFGNDINRFFGNDIADLLALGAPGLEAADEDDGPFETPNEAYDAYCRRTGETIVWAGTIAGRAHWYSREPQEIARTDLARMLAYDGQVAQDVTGHVIDDWSTLCADQLTIW